MALLLGIGIPYLEKKTYSEEVFAEIIDYEEYATDAYGKMYIAILKYSYNGEEYVVKDKKRKFREGDDRYKYDVLTLKINPKRPEEYIIQLSMTDTGIGKRDKAVLMMLGCFIAVVLIMKFAPPKMFLVLYSILFGAGIVAFIIFIKKSATSKWVEVEAEIVDTEQRATKGGMMLVHVYQYEYEGVEYKSMAVIGSARGKGNIGRKVKIKIKADNPNIVSQSIEYKDLPSVSRFLIWFGGLAIIILCILLFFL